MDDFQGLLERDFGLRPQGKAAPMSAARAAAPSGSGWTNPRSSSASAAAAAPSAPSYDDLFGPAASAPPPKSTPSPSLDSIFDSFKEPSAAVPPPKPNHSSMPVFDKPVYDDDIFDGVPGVKSSSARFDDVFGGKHAPPPAYDDLLGGFGRKADAREAPEERRKPEPAAAPTGFDDLIPGFGGSSSVRQWMSGQTSGGLGQQAGWDKNLPGSNCLDKTRKRLRSGKCYGFWSPCPKERRVLPTCYRCGEVGHITVGCTLGRVKVCQRCGEEGHYSHQCTSACPNCDEDHLPGNCPTAKVTCFLCEGNDHYPKGCGLNRVIAKSVELQQRILRASVSLATTDAAQQEKFLGGLSEELRDKVAVYGFPDLQTLVDNTIMAIGEERALKEFRKRQKKARGDLRNSAAEVTCFFCQLKGHYANNCPKRVAATPRPPQAVSQPRTPASQQGGLRDVAEVTCFFCRKKGHYANKCPTKHQDQKVARGQVHSISAKEAPDVVLGSDEYVDLESDPLQHIEHLQQEEVDPQGIDYRDTDFDFDD